MGWQIQYVSVAEGCEPLTLVEGSVPLDAMRSMLCSCLSSPFPMPTVTVRGLETPTRRSLLGHAPLPFLPWQLCSHQYCLHCFSVQGIRHRVYSEAKEEKFSYGPLPATSDGTLRTSQQYPFPLSVPPNMASQKDHRDEFTDLDDALWVIISVCQTSALAIP